MPAATNVSVTSWQRTEGRAGQARTLTAPFLAILLMTVVVAWLTACSAPATGQADDPATSSAPAASSSPTVAPSPSPSKSAGTPEPTPVATPRTEACMILGAALDTQYPKRYTRFGLEDSAWELGDNACWVGTEDDDDNSYATLIIYRADQYKSKAKPIKGSHRTAITDVGDEAVLFTKKALVNYLYVRSGRHSFLLTYDEPLASHLAVAEQVIKRLP